MFQYNITRQLTAAARLHSLPAAPLGTRGYGRIIITYQQVPTVVAAAAVVSPWSSFVALGPFHCPLS